MADEFPKLKRPTFILVTGLPHTGSHGLSRCIADWAKCPWLTHEVILDSLSEDRDRGSLPSEEEAARLLCLSFDITCSSALFQLSECAPTECVVISSSILSYKSQLLGLLNILQRNLSVGRSRRLLIIDCLRKNKFLWQREIDVKDCVAPWYEPKSWKDVEKAILNRQQEGLEDYYLTLLQHTLPTRVDAIKLVLDLNEDLNTNDYDFDYTKRALNRRSLFIEAIKDILTCNDVNNYGDGSHVVDYPLWRRHRLEELGRSFASRVTTLNHWCPRRSECIFRLTHNLIQKEEEEEAICEICDGKITRTERAYYCQFCSLSFHQACCCVSPTMTAEMFSQVLDYIKYCRRYDEEFFEIYACYSCIRGDQGFSGTCDSCIYRTILKSRLLSPVLRHSCDQDHILTTGLSQGTLSLLYFCRACGRFGMRSAYCCNICSSSYHMECLHLPLQKEHQHGAHLHSIKMEFSCPKEEEYEWCLACYKDIDPQTWVYSCQECDYVAHLYCVFPFLSKRFPWGPSD